MSPSLLPQQRIVAVADLFDRPQPFDSVDGIDEKPPGVKYAKGPAQTPLSRAKVEWSWSSMHGSVTGYYIHKGRQHWVLWEYWYDDNWDKWEWLRVGYVPQAQATPPDMQPNC